MHIIQLPMYLVQLFIRCHLKPTHLHVITCFLLLNRLLGMSIKLDMKHMVNCLLLISMCKRPCHVLSMPNTPCQSMFQLLFILLVPVMMLIKMTRINLVM
uniref:Uncharacterized protein n=1 Tax=Arundo donax TaxID=35708 RepID=A0A0A9DLE0_ARUDO